MKKLTIIYLFVLSSFNLFSQWKEVEIEAYVATIIEFEKKIEGHGKFAYDMVYKLYEQADDALPQLTYQGSLVCVGNRNYTIKQFGRLILQDADLNITIDSTDRTIIVEREKQGLSYTKAMSEVGVQVNDIFKVQKWEKDGVKRFSLEMPEGSKYNVIELEFQNKLINKMTLYTGDLEVEDDLGKQKSIRPKMEIYFKNYRFDDKIKANEAIGIAQYLIKDKKIQLQPLYAGNYELIDLRISDEK